MEWPIVWMLLLGSHLGREDVVGPASTDWSSQ